MSVNFLIKRAKEIQIVIDNNAHEIEKLDQEIGDGDHIFNVKRGIKLVEKKGMLISKALSLSEEKKNVNTNWYKFVNSSPGKVNAFIIIILKCQHLQFGQI